MDRFRAVVARNADNAVTADRLCAVGRCRSLASRQQLPPDPEEDRLVFVAAGAAKLVAQPPAETGAQGRANDKARAGGQVLAFHFPGDIVSVLRERDGGFRLIALNDLECIIFATDQFLDVAEGDPAVIRTVLARSLEALHRSRSRMLQMGHKSARQRIADFLVSMAERMCGSTTGACQLTLPMSRGDIGDSLGLTIETVSRQFAELRTAGLVETEGRSLVRLPDLARLHLESGAY